VAACLENNTSGTKPLEKNYESRGQRTPQQRTTERSDGETWWYNNTWSFSDWRKKTLVTERSVEEGSAWLTTSTGRDYFKPEGDISLSESRTDLSLAWSSYNRNRNRNLQTSKAPLKSQVQGTSFMNIQTLSHTCIKTCVRHESFLS